MMNMVICYEKAVSEKKEPFFFVVYADSKFLSMPQKIRGQEWNELLSIIQPNSIKVGTIAYQEFILNALAATANDPTFIELRDWIIAKIKLAEVKSQKQ